MSKKSYYDKFKNKKKSKKSNKNVLDEIKEVPIPPIDSTDKAVFNLGIESVDLSEIDSGLEAYNKRRRNKKDDINLDDYKNDPKISQQTRKDFLDTLKNVTETTIKVEEKIMGISPAINRGLDPSKAAILAPNDRNDGIKEYGTNGMFNINAMTKNGVNLDDVIGKRVENTTASSILYMPTGSYKATTMCRKNMFMENRLPLLKKSLQLFVGDINNGSYTGDNHSFLDRYAIFEGELPVEDQAVKESIINIINPKDSETFKGNKRSHLSVDSEMDFICQRDGYSFARIIPHSKIMKELYVKYIMKKKKQKEMTKNGSVTTSITVNNTKGLESLSKIFDVKFDTINDANEFLKSLPEDGLEALIADRSFIKYFDVHNTYTYILPSSENVKLSNFDAQELYVEESFEEFCYRYLTGSCEEIQNASFSDKNKVVKSNIKYKNRLLNLGINFTFEVNKLDTNDALDIYKETFIDKSYLTNQIIGGTESFDIAMESLDSRLSSSDLNNLMNISFSDIYSVSYLSLESVYSSSINQGSESVGSISFFNPRNTIEDLFLKTLRSEEIGYDVSVGVEDISSASNYSKYVAQNVIPGLEVDGNGKYGQNVDKDLFKGLGYQGTNADIDQIEKDIKQELNLHSRLDKMFAHVQGETIEVLDNTRVVPIKGADSLLGVLYNVYTHKEIQQIAGIRSIATNPSSYMNNMDMFDIDSETHEETFARMIFTDTIRPILDKHLDTKFLKNNVDIVYTLQRLLEEDEIGRSNTLGDISRSNLHNLAKVIFIPASSLIFRRNTSKGLGESKYDAVTIPANIRILMDELIVTHYLFDCKGITFLQVPKGFGDKNEYGLNSLQDEISQLTLNRSDIMDMGSYDFQLTHKFAVVHKNGENGSPMDINTIQMPAIEFDQEYLSRVDQIYTSYVGYSSALILANSDGSNTELARKLFELDNTKVLDIEMAQREKVQSSSELATKMLRIRGGSKYANFRVEWIPPELNRGNRNTSSEKIEEFGKYLNSVLDLYSNVYEGDTNFEGAKKHIKLEILKQTNPTDIVIKDIEEIVKRGIESAKAAVAVDVIERDDETGEITDTFTETTPLDAK